MNVRGERCSTVVSKVDQRGCNDANSCVHCHNGWHLAKIWTRSHPIDAAADAFFRNATSSILKKYTVKQLLDPCYLFSILWISLDYNRFNYIFILNGIRFIFIYYQSSWMNTWHLNGTTGRKLSWFKHTSNRSISSSGSMSTKMSDIGSSSIKLLVRGGRLMIFDRMKSMILPYAHND